MNDFPLEHNDEDFGAQETGFSIFVEGQNDDRPRRDLLVLKCGGLTLGIYADETDSIFDWKSPTPLPYAPKAIMGVINARGRILTVVDPGELFPTSGPDISEAKLVVSLRGDEQLGLAVDRVLQIVEIVSEEVIPQPENEETPFLGSIQIDGEAVSIFEPGKLFELATRRTDRRRNRS